MSLELEAAVERAARQIDPEAYEQMQLVLHYDARRINNIRIRSARDRALAAMIPALELARHQAGILKDMAPNTEFDRGYQAGAYAMHSRLDGLIAELEAGNAE